MSDDVKTYDEFDADDIESGKMMALLCYVPCCGINLVGLILAFIKKDNDFHLFHARQALGLTILGVAFGFVMGILQVLVAILGGMSETLALIGVILLGLVALVGGLGMLFLTVMGILATFKPEFKAIPMVGDMFVEKFSFLQKQEG